MLGARCSPARTVLEQTGSSWHPFSVLSCRSQTHPAIPTSGKSARMEAKRDGGSKLCNSSPPPFGTCNSLLLHYYCRPSCAIELLLVHTWSDIPSRPNKCCLIPELRLAPATEDKPQPVQTSFVPPHIPPSPARHDILKFSMAWQCYPST
jgi:hypothetical protein